MNLNSIPPFKLVFFGTPEFAVPTLNALHESSNFEICLVVSQPDRPSGRKLKLTPSPVKTWAEAHGLPVITPENCKTEEFIQHFKSLKVDAAVVVAFGQILTQKLLDVCPNRFINIHASRLPRWRGAAPIQRAIMCGDQITGVSAQVMVKRLDAGDVIFEQDLAILPSENSINLHDRLAQLASSNCVVGITSYLMGNTSTIKQDESLVTYATKIEKSETWVDWSMSAQEIWNHVRGLALGPGGTTVFNSKRLKITLAKPWDFESYKENSADLNSINSFVKPSDLETKQPGEVLIPDSKEIFVVCGQNKRSLLQILEVQPDSKPRMVASDFVNGWKLKSSDIFTTFK